MRTARPILVSLAGTLLLIAGCTPKDAVDEATASGKTVADFPQTTVDVFREMDLGVALTPEEVAGRNTWMLWTGGNEAFWDYLARNGYGLIDFLKVVDSRHRPERFKKFGLMNEPGYQQASAPDEFGIYLDRPISPAPDGTNPAVDGLSTGVIGFRLFPNPNFDEAAKKDWDAKRYYTDPSYFQNPKLVRPYRVGMTCALCHVAFHPLKPPQDPEAPRWENLSSTLGNQYLRTRGVFGGDLKPDNFMYHILESAHPGTVETSIIATDNNNNPNIINSIYNVRARLAIATEETMAGPAVDFPPGGENAPRAARPRRRRRLDRSRRARSIASSSTSACSAKNGCAVTTRSWAVERRSRSRFRTRASIPFIGGPRKSARPISPLTSRG